MTQSKPETKAGKRQVYNRNYYLTHVEEFKKYRELYRERDNEQRRLSYQNKKDRINERRRQRYKEFGNPNPNRTYTPEQIEHRKIWRREHYKAKLRYDPAYTEARRRYTTSEQGKIKRRAAEKRRRIEKRQQVIDALGKVCKRCGFSDPHALQFDHINGGGCFFTLGGGNSKFSVILANLDQFQLLCANCNWIKREENQEYGPGYIERIAPLRDRPEPYWK